MGISAKLTYPAKPGCVACGRTGVPLHTVAQDGQELEICVDPVACRAHWPEQDKRALALAASKRRHPSVSGVLYGH